MELRNKRRILIIGCPGSGKSILAKILADKLNLEIFHMDKYFWKPNWVMRDKNEFTETVKDLIMRDNWIIEGNYSNTLRLRAHRADLVIFFDFPSYFCTFRIFKRNIKSKFGLEKRDDMAIGCEEKWFDWEFVKFTWKFNKDIRPLNYEILNELDFLNDKSIIFKTPKEVKDFIKNIGSGIKK